MKLPGFWILSLICLTIFAKSIADEPRVVCYYTNWSIYRPGTAKYSPQNINPYLCTHLIYAFGGFTKDSTLQPFDKYQDIEKGGYAKFTGLKTYNKNLKTLLAIGGWNEASSRFSPLVGDAERRRKFVKNAIKYLRQNHFDGLDLDWEYPTFRDGGKPKDKVNYAQFVQELREEFDRESSKTGRPRLLLTLAIPAGVDKIDQGYDVVKLNQYLDWFNVLTYDYHDSFEPATNHHAPLYSLEEDDEYNYDSELNIDYSVKHLINVGADRQKLVLGIPTYGRSYTLFNADANEIGAPTDGPGEPGDATREKGFLAYYEICQSIKSDEDWTVMHPNDNVMGPYLYKDDQWISYDDEKMARKKAQYVAKNGLGGIMFWSIDTDDFRGECSGKPYPLIEAAKEGLYDALGVKLIETKESPVKSTSQNRPRPTKKPIASNEASSSVKDNFTRRRKPTQSRTTAEPKKSSIVYNARTTTPEPPTTPDPGSDFKCEEEGFFSHPRDCKKYFWCLDSGPSNLGIVAHQFTCPSGLVFNKQADSCDYARNVVCEKIKDSTTTTAAPRTTSKTTTKLSTQRTTTFRTTTSRPTTTTTPEYEDDEEEYEDDELEPERDIEDPKVIKELIDLIKKAGGLDNLEKHLKISEDNLSVFDVTKSDKLSTTPATFSKSLYDKVLIRKPENRFVKTENTNKVKSDREVVNVTPKVNNTRYSSVYRNSRPSPQNAGLEEVPDFDAFLKEKPQYVTIQRHRTTTTARQGSGEEDIEDEDEDEYSTTQSSYQVTAQPQYVSIQRNRGTPVSTVSGEVESEEVVQNTFSRPVESGTPRPQYTSINRRRRPENVASGEVTESAKQYGPINRGGGPTSNGADDASDTESAVKYSTISRDRKPEISVDVSSGTESSTQYTTINGRRRPDNDKATSSQTETESTQYTSINRRRRPDNSDSAEIITLPDTETTTTKYTSINRRQKPDTTEEPETESTTQYTTINSRRRPDISESSGKSSVSETDSNVQTDEVISSVKTRTQTRYQSISRGSTAASLPDNVQEDKNTNSQPIAVEKYSDSHDEKEEDVDVPTKRVLPALLNSNTKYQTITRNQLKTTILETTTADEINHPQNTTTDLIANNVTQKETPPATPEINNNLIGFNINHTNNELTTTLNQNDQTSQNHSNINITANEINNDITFTLKSQQHSSSNGTLDLNDVHANTIENVTEFIATKLSSPRPFGFQKPTTRTILLNPTRAPKVSEVENLETNKTISPPSNNDPAINGTTQQSDGRPLIDRRRFRISSSTNQAISSQTLLESQNIITNFDADDTTEEDTLRPTFNRRGNRIFSSTNGNSNTGYEQTTIQGSSSSSDRRGFRISTSSKLDTSQEVTHSPSSSRRGFRVSTSSTSNPSIESFDRRGFRISSAPSANEINSELRTHNQILRESEETNLKLNITKDEEIIKPSPNRHGFRITSANKPISVNESDTNDASKQEHKLHSNNTGGFKISYSTASNIDSTTTDFTTISEQTLSSYQSAGTSSNPKASISNLIVSDVTTLEPKLESSTDSRESYKISSFTTPNVEITTDFEQTTIPEKLSSQSPVSGLESKTFPSNTPNLDSTTVFDQTTIGQTLNSWQETRRRHRIPSTTTSNLDSTTDLGLSTGSVQIKTNSGTTNFASLNSITDIGQGSISSQSVPESQNLTVDLSENDTTTLKSLGSSISRGSFKISSFTTPNIESTSDFEQTTASKKFEFDSQEGTRKSLGNRTGFKISSSTTPNLDSTTFVEQTTVSDQTLLGSRTSEKETITSSGGRTGYRISSITPNLDSTPEFKQTTVAENNELISERFDIDSKIGNQEKTLQFSGNTEEFRILPSTTPNVYSTPDFDQTTVSEQILPDTQTSETDLGTQIRKQEETITSSVDRRGYRISSVTDTNLDSTTDFEQTTVFGSQRSLSNIGSKISVQEKTLKFPDTKEGFKIMSSTTPNVPSTTDFDQTTVSQQILLDSQEETITSSGDKIGYRISSITDPNLDSTTEFEQTTVSEQVLHGSQISETDLGTQIRNHDKTIVASVDTRGYRISSATSSNLDSTAVFDQTTISEPLLKASINITNSRISTSIIPNLESTTVLDQTTSSEKNSIGSSIGRRRLKISSSTISNIDSTTSQDTPTSETGLGLNRTGYRISRPTLGSTTEYDQSTTSEQPEIISPSVDRRGYRISSSTNTNSNTELNSKTFNNPISSEINSNGSSVGRRRLKISISTNSNIDSTTSQDTPTSETGLGLNINNQEETITSSHDRIGYRISRPTLGSTTEYDQTTTSEQPEIISPSVDRRGYRISSSTNTNSNTEPNSKTFINRGHSRISTSTTPNVPSTTDFDQTTVSQQILLDSQTSETDLGVQIRNQEETITSSVDRGGYRISPITDSNLDSTTDFEQTTVSEKIEHGLASNLGSKISVQEKSLQSSDNIEGFRILSSTTPTLDSTTDFDQTTISEQILHGPQTSETDLGTQIRNHDKTTVASVDTRGYRISSETSSNLDSTTVFDQTTISTSTIPNLESTTVLDQTTSSETNSIGSSIGRKRLKISSSTISNIDSTTSQGTPTSETGSGLNINNQEETITSSHDRTGYRISRPTLGSTTEYDQSTTSEKPEIISPSVDRRGYRISSSTNANSNTEPNSKTVINRGRSRISTSTTPNLEFTTSFDQTTASENKSFSSQKEDTIRSSVDRRRFRISSSTISNIDSSTNSDETIVSDKTIAFDSKVNTNEGTITSSGNRRGYRISTSTSPNLGSTTDYEQTTKIESSASRSSDSHIQNPVTLSSQTVPESQNLLFSLNANHTTIHEFEIKSTVDREGLGISNTTNPNNVDLEQTTISYQALLEVSTNQSGKDFDQTTISNQTLQDSQTESGIEIEPLTNSVNDLDGTTVYDQTTIESQSTPVNLGSPNTRVDFEQTTASNLISLESESSTNEPTKVNLDKFGTNQNNVGVEQTAISNKTSIRRTFKRPLLRNQSRTSSNTDTEIKQEKVSSNFEENDSVTQASKLKPSFGRPGFKISSTNVPSQVLDLEQITISSQTILESENSGTNINIKGSKFKSSFSRPTSKVSSATSPSPINDTEQAIISSQNQEPTSKSIVDRRRFKSSSPTTRPTVLVTERTTTPSQNTPEPRIPPPRTIIRSRGSVKFNTRTTTEPTEIYANSPNRNNVTRKYRPVIEETSEAVNYNSLLDRNTRPEVLDELSSLTSFDFNRKNYNSRDRAVRKRPRPTVVTSTTTQEISSLSTESISSTETSTTTENPGTSSTAVNGFTRKTLNTRLPVIRRRLRPAVVTSTTTEEISPISTESISSTESGTTTENSENSTSTVNGFTRKTLNTRLPVIIRRPRPTEVTSTTTEEISSISTESISSTESGITTEETDNTESSSSIVNDLNSRVPAIRRRPRPTFAARTTTQTIESESDRKIEDLEDVSDVPNRNNLIRKYRPVTEEPKKAVDYNALLDRKVRPLNLDELSSLTSNDFTRKSNSNGNLVVRRRPRPTVGTTSTTTTEISSTTLSEPDVSTGGSRVYKRPVSQFLYTRVPENLPNPVEINQNSSSQVNTPNETTPESRTDPPVTLSLSKSLDFGYASRTPSSAVETVFESDSESIPNTTSHVTTELNDDTTSFSTENILPTTDDTTTAQDSLNVTTDFNQMTNNDNVTNPIQNVSDSVTLRPKPKSRVRTVKRLRDPVKLITSTIESTNEITATGSTENQTAINFSLPDPTTTTITTTVIETIANEGFNFQTIDNQTESTSIAGRRKFQSRISTTPGTVITSESSSEVANQENGLNGAVNNTARFGVVNRTFRRRPSVTKLEAKSNDTLVKENVESSAQTEPTPQSRTRVQSNSNSQGTSRFNARTRRPIKKLEAATDNGVNADGNESVVEEELETSSQKSSFIPTRRAFRQRISPTSTTVSIQSTAEADSQVSENITSNGGPRSTVKPRFKITRRPFTQLEVTSEPLDAAEIDTNVEIDTSTPSRRSFASRFSQSQRPSNPSRFNARTFTKKPTTDEPDNGYDNLPVNDEQLDPAIVESTTEARRQFVQRPFATRATVTAQINEETVSEIESSAQNDTSTLPRRKFVSRVSTSSASPNENSVNIKSLNASRYNLVNRTRGLPTKSTTEGAADDKTEESATVDVGENNTEENVGTDPQESGNTDSNIISTTLEDDSTDVNLPTSTEELRSTTIQNPSVKPRRKVKIVKGTRRPAINVTSTESVNAEEKSEASTLLPKLEINAEDEDNLPLDNKESEFNALKTMEFENNTSTSASRLKVPNRTFIRRPVTQPEKTTNDDNVEEKLPTVDKDADSNSQIDSSIQTKRKYISRTSTTQTNSVSGGQANGARFKVRAFTRKPVQNESDDEDIDQEESIAFDSKEIRSNNQLESSAPTRRTFKPRFSPTPRTLSTPTDGETENSTSNGASRFKVFNRTFTRKPITPQLETSVNGTVDEDNNTEYVESSSQFDSSSQATRTPVRLPGNRVRTFTRKPTTSEPIEDDVNSEENVPLDNEEIELNDQQGPSTTTRRTFRPRISTASFRANEQVNITDEQSEQNSPGDEEIESNDQSRRTYTSRTSGTNSEVNLNAAGVPGSRVRTFTRKPVTADQIAEDDVNSEENVQSEDEEIESNVQPGSSTTTRRTFRPRIFTTPSSINKQVNKTSEQTEENSPGDAEVDSNSQSRRTYISRASASESNSEGNLNAARVPGNRIRAFTRKPTTAEPNDDDVNSGEDVPSDNGDVDSNAQLSSSTTTRRTFRPRIFATPSSVNKQVDINDEQSEEIIPGDEDLESNDQSRRTYISRTSAAQTNSEISQNSAKAPGYRIRAFTRKPTTAEPIDDNVNSEENVPSDNEDIESNVQPGSSTSTRRTFRPRIFTTPSTIKQINSTNGQSDNKVVKTSSIQGDSETENQESSNIQKIPGYRVRTIIKKPTTTSTSEPIDDDVISEETVTSSNEEIESNTELDSTMPSVENNQTKEDAEFVISENLDSTTVGVENNEDVERSTGSVEEIESNTQLSANLNSTGIVDEDNTEESTTVNNGDIEFNTQSLVQFVENNQTTNFNGTVNSSEGILSEGDEVSNAQTNSSTFRPNISTNKTSEETEIGVSEKLNSTIAPRFKLLNRTITRKPLTRLEVTSNGTDNEDISQQNLPDGNDESSGGPISSTTTRRTFRPRIITTKSSVNNETNETEVNENEDEEVGSNGQINITTQSRRTYISRTSAVETNSETESKVPAYKLRTFTRKPVTNAPEDEGDNSEENIPSDNEEINSATPIRKPFSPRVSTTSSNSETEIRISQNSNPVKYNLINRTRKPFGQRPDVNDNDSEEHDEDDTELDLNTQIDAVTAKRKYISRITTTTAPPPPRFKVFSRPSTRKPSTTTTEENFYDSDDDEDDDNAEENFDDEEIDGNSQKEPDNVNIRLPIPRYKTFDRSSTNRPFVRPEINEPEDNENIEDSEEFDSNSQTEIRYPSRTFGIQSNSETETRVSGSTNSFGPPRYGVINRTRKPFTKPEINNNDDNSEENLFSDNEDSKSNAPNDPSIQARPKFGPRVSNTPAVVNSGGGLRVTSNVPRFRPAPPRPSPNLVINANIDEEDGNEEDDEENDRFEQNLTGGDEGGSTYNKFETSSQTIRKFKPGQSVNSVQLNTQTSSESSLPAGYRNKSIFQRKPYIKPVYTKEASDSDDEETTNTEEDLIETTTMGEFIPESETLPTLNTILTQTSNSSEQINSSTNADLGSHIVDYKNETNAESELHKNELDAGLVIKGPVIPSSASAPKIVNKPIARTLNNFSKLQSTQTSTGSKNSPVQSIKIDSSKYIPFHLRQQQNTFNKQNGVLTTTPPKASQEEIETTTESLSYTDYTNIQHSTTLDTTTPIPSSIEDINLYSTLLSQDSTTTVSDEDVEKVTDISISLLKSSKPTTTSKPTTLHHIFAVDYDSAEEDRNNGTNLGNRTEVNGNTDDSSKEASAEEISQRLEKLVEINRIVEIYSKQQKNGRNDLSANSNELILEQIPTIDKIGEISRWISVKLQNHNSSSSTNKFQEILNNITQLATGNLTANTTLNSKMVFDVETSTIPLEGLFDKNKKKINENEVIVYEVTKPVATPVPSLPLPVVPLQIDDNPKNLDSFAGATSFGLAAATIPSHNYVQQLRPESHEANPLVISIANLDQVVLTKNDKIEKIIAFPSVISATTTEPSNQLTFSSSNLDLTN